MGNSKKIILSIERELQYLIESKEIPGKKLQFEMKLRQGGEECN